MRRPQAVTAIALLSLLLGLAAVCLAWDRVVEYRWRDEDAARLAIAPEHRLARMAMLRSAGLMLGLALILLASGWGLFRLVLRECDAALTPPLIRGEAPLETDSSPRSWRPAELLIATAISGIIMGIIAAFAIPNLMGGIPRGKQKRTMSDMRSLGTAVESYWVDYAHPPLAPSSDDASRALRMPLEPTFFKLLPRTDAWSAPFIWLRSPEGYTILSYGEDGRLDAGIAGGATTGYARDIYYNNGQFTQYPEGTQP